jgi:hypothetical protein
MFKLEDVSAMGAASEAIEAATSLKAQRWFAIGAVKTAAGLRPSSAIETQMAEYSFKIANRLREPGVVETGRRHGAALNGDRRALDLSDSERYLDACTFCNLINV